MKFLALSFILAAPAFCGAEIFIMKDGARLEGEVTGEMDGTLLVLTRYGSLTLNKSDVSERQPSGAPAPAEPPAVSSAAPATELPVSSSASTALILPPVPDTARAQFVFAPLQDAEGRQKVVYYEAGVAIATETLNAAGAVVSLEGSIRDGVYSEFFASGAIKTLKPFSGGRLSGTLKTYYPTGLPQIEASYLAGIKSGTFLFFSEDGSPTMEAAYANDKLNGWKKEFAPDGSVRTEIYYTDDQAGDPPKEKGAKKEDESMVTAKAARIARGEILSFSLNGKYIGKARLDKDNNVITQQGKVPDGTVRIYSAEGKLRKELVFKGNEIRIIRTYDGDGELKDTYTVTEGRAFVFTAK